MYEARAEGFVRALGYLVVAFIVYMAFWFARASRGKDKEKASPKLIGQALLVVVGIATAAAVWKGDPVCVDSETDPFGGTCYEWDDGFDATLPDRAETFAYFLALFGIPVAIGLFGKAET